MKFELIEIRIYCYDLEESMILPGAAAQKLKKIREKYFLNHK